MRKRYYLPVGSEVWNIDELTDAELRHAVNAWRADDDDRGNSPDALENIDQLTDAELRQIMTQWRDTADDYVYVVRGKQGFQLIYHYPSSAEFVDEDGTDVTFDDEVGRFLFDSRAPK